MNLLMNIISICVVIIGIAFTIFVNYPEPPLSPLLYQWQLTGKHFHFREHQIFYKYEQTYAQTPAQTHESNNITVVCLHGFPTSSFDWYKVWPDLRRNVRLLIAPDFLGYGFSDKPRFHTYTITEQADLVEDLMAQNKIKRIHILAHDYGDTVTQELLSRQIEGILTFSIDSVCLLNGGIFPNKHRPRLMQYVLKAPIIGTILSKLANYYMFKWSLSEVFGENTQPEMHEFHDMWKIARHKDGYRVWGDLLAYIDERHQNEDKWIGALQNGKTPLHFIYGPSDPVNPPPFPDFYREIIPNASIDVIPNIGHYVQLEAPKQMINLYFNWMKRIGFINQIIYNN